MKSKKLQHEFAIESPVSGFQSCVMAHLSNRVTDRSMILGEQETRSIPVVPAMVAPSQGSMKTTLPSLVLGTIIPMFSGE